MKLCGAGRPAFVCLILGASLLAERMLVAQTTRSSNSGGFAATLESTASGGELKAQPELWVMEVSFKPLRMIWTDVTDPKTGRKSRELVWYLVYRAVNRPLERRQDSTTTEPQNYEDAPPPQMFVPEFTLVLEDEPSPSDLNGGLVSAQQPLDKVANGKASARSEPDAGKAGGVAGKAPAGANDYPRVVPDVVIPEAQALILERESRGGKPEFRNNVEIVQPVPPPTAPAKAGAAQQPPGPDGAIYGVVTWRDVDPRTDYFSIYMTGFSNGRQFIKGPLSYETLKKLAEKDELKSDDLLFTGPEEWMAAGSVGGLFDKEPPPAGAETANWWHSVPVDRVDLNKPPPIWRRTIRQSYWRPGDEFRQNEREIRPRGGPTWIYYPDEAKPAPASKPADSAAPANAKKQP